MVRQLMNNFNKMKKYAVRRVVKTIITHDKKVLKMILAQNPLSTSFKVFSKAGLSGILKREKKPKILRNLDNIK